ncbi:MAG: CPA2 family monovalent cation:H+ antiporter-2 [Rhodothermales bacterium]
MLAVTLPFLNEMVALFVAAVGIAYVCYRLRLVPIAGFLIAGVIIGPSALGLVQNQELVDMLAEIGVILLLFTIGMEFSLEKLSKIGRAIFVGGGLQVALTVSIVTGVLVAIGVDVRAGIYTGCLIALSSTAIVLGLLAERDETDTPVGKLSLAVLIFQDLAIIVMVLMVPILAGSGGSTAELLGVLGKAVALIVGILVLARRVVPWILEKVAHTRRQELFLLTVVAICFGTAAISSLAGVSLALGAFLAGLVVSESHYSEQALSDVLPLRTIFNAVFFVSVGMLLDLGFLIERPLLVLAAAGIVIVVKIITTTGSILVLGYPMRIAAATGLVLAQIGEFSFVLERAGRLAGMTPGGLGEAGAQTFIAATVLLMLLTPLQMAFAHRFGAFASRGPLSKLGDESASETDQEDVDLEDHVVVVGYGPAGQRLVRVMQDRGIPFVVIEMNPESVDTMHKEGIHAIYGDASRAGILEAAHVGEAKLCVVVINDPSIAPRIIQQARYLNPTLEIIARTRYLGDMERLQRFGADIIVPEEMETTVRIFSHVLGAYLIPAEEIDRQVKMLRAHDYGVMRGSIQEAHLMVLQGLDEDGMHTRAVAVRAGSPAAERTLAELALRRDHGLTVLAVRREGKTIASPSGDFKVHTGDRLVLVGTAHKFAECADLFRAPVAQLPNREPS